MTTLRHCQVYRVNARIGRMCRGGKDDDDNDDDDDVFFMFKNLICSDTVMPSSGISP